MNIDELAQNIKENIDKFSSDDIKQAIIGVCKEMMTNHLINEKQTNIAKVEANIAKGLPARPILVINYGVSNINPADAQIYLQNTIKHLESVLPATEYAVLVIPTDTVTTTVEIISAAKLTKKQNTDLVDKINKLTEYFNLNLDSKD